MDEEGAEAPRKPGAAPDEMAAVVDRLVQLVREQDAQIKALREMVEALL